MGDEIAKTGAKAFDQPGLRRRDKPRPVVIIKRQPRELAAKIGEDRAVGGARLERRARNQFFAIADDQRGGKDRSEEHTSELQSLMRISYAVFCLKKKKDKQQHQKNAIIHTKQHTSYT